MINKEDILEGGNLIAIFMDLPKVDGYDNVFRINDGQSNWYSTEPKYHESWDWSMDVATKINGLGKEFSLATFKNYVSLTVEKGGKVYKDFSFAHAEYITAEQTGREAMFKLLVKFVKWYNEHIIKKIQDGNNT
jgi:hypothetical protein